MSLLRSPSFLRHVMLADAAVSGASGALHLAATAALVPVLGLPGRLLEGTGWFYLAYACACVAVAVRQPVPVGWVRLFALGNGLFGLACVGLLASAAVAPTALGTAYVLVQALGVWLLGGLQALGARGGPPLARG